ncbi:hypothetical protein HID58_013837, partial [Brassica napus]
VLLLALSSSSFTRGQRIIQIPPPRPLCVSQYALANYACSRVPVTTSLWMIHASSHSPVEADF